MNRITARLLGVMIVAAAAGAQADPGQLCFDPQRPCPGFQAHDLSFQLVNDGVARAEQRSVPFFAVILRTVAKCRASEAERREIQALFPGHKVFASRFECEGNVENNVGYSNVDAKRGFIAVYGGQTRATASEVLAKAKMLNRFPGVNLRQMQVIYSYP